MIISFMKTAALLCLEFLNIECLLLELNSSYVRFPKSCYSGCLYLVAVLSYYVTIYQSSC